MVTGNIFLLTYLLTYSIFGVLTPKGVRNEWKGGLYNAWTLPTIFLVATRPVRAPPRRYAEKKRKNKRHCWRRHMYIREKKETFQNKRHKPKKIQKRSKIDDILQSYNVGYYEICEQFQKYVFIMQRWAVRL
jgi:hypothetical protein